MNGGVVLKNSSITYDFAQPSGKFRRLPETYCMTGIRQKQSRAFRDLSCYDVEVAIPRNFKSLVVICSTADDKKTFLKNIGRLLELQREVDLSFKANKNIIWRCLDLKFEHYNLHASKKDASRVSYRKIYTQLFQKEAEILTPEQKIKVDLEGKDSFFEVDDQILLASALEQLEILNKEVTALRDRVNSSLERMDEMEKKNG